MSHTYPIYAEHPSLCKPLTKVCTKGLYFSINLVPAKLICAMHGETLWESDYGFSFPFWQTEFKKMGAINSGLSLNRFNIFIICGLSFQTWDCRTWPKLGTRQGFHGFHVHGTSVFAKHNKIEFQEMGICKATIKLNSKKWNFQPGVRNTF